MDDNELLDKANALLARYRSAPPPDFPTLTEIVELPAAPRAAAMPIGLPVRDTTIDDLQKLIEAELESLELRVGRRIDEVVGALEYSSTYQGVVASRIEADLEVALRRIAGDLSALIGKKVAAVLSEQVSEAVQTEIRSLRAGFRQRPDA